MSATPSLEDVVAFVRRYARLPDSRPITGETRLETDLGITGDDGSDLLECAERHFKVALISKEKGVRETFELGPNEYLFGPEGFDPIGISAVLRWLSGKPRPPRRPPGWGGTHAISLLLLLADATASTRRRASIWHSSRSQQTSPYLWK